MRVHVLAVSALLLAAPASPQQTGTPANGSPSTAPGAQPATPAAAAPATPDLPVSLDRIREGLAKPDGHLQHLDLKPDFVVRVEERDHIISILSNLEVPPGSPSPGGGLYGFEQQRLAIPKGDRPLMQPYAAFSGGELITLAIEGLAQRYLKETVGKAITNTLRLRAEQAAREEVATAIAQYCDGQPDGGRALHLCSEVVAR